MLKDRVYFILKRPGKEKGRKAKSFSFQKKTIKPDGTSHWEAVEPNGLANLNKQFQDGDLDFQEAEVQALELREQLYRAERGYAKKTVHLAENLTLLKRYWKVEYEDRSLVDENSAKGDLKRAVEAAGNKSLNTVSREELKKVINTRFKNNPEKQRRIVARLNQLLKFAKRDFRLKPVKKPRRQVRYLTLEDFEKVVPHLPNEVVQALCWTAFSTGARKGECFAVSEGNLRQGTNLYIFEQLADNRKLRDLKNRKPHSAPIIRKGLPHVKRWLAIPKTEKEALRGLRLSDLVKSACYKVFPKDPEKHCTFHDLRHSYAIYLLQRGLTLFRVSRCLGDSMAVTEEYYALFANTDEELEAIGHLLED